MTPPDGPIPCTMRDMRLGACAKRSDCPDSHTNAATLLARTARFIPGHSILTRSRRSIGIRTVRDDLTAWANCSLCNDRDGRRQT